MSNKDENTKRKFKCEGCGEDRPCIVETNHPRDHMLGTEDLSCVLDETNQTGFYWKEIYEDDE